MLKLKKRGSMGLIVTNPLVTLLICLIVMFILSEALRVLSVPRVVSEIIAGMLLGLPVLKGILFTDESVWLIGFLAEIGVILLLFFVGLKIEVSRWNKQIVSCAWISAFNTSLPLIFGF